MITYEIAHEFFSYKDGILYWKKLNSNNQVKIGDEAGCVNTGGYKVVFFLGKRLRIHRIIYLMFNGFVPKQIDHIDGNTLNNKIENLRSASHSENMQNKCIQKNNTSGVKGVFWEKYAKKWRAQIKVDNKKIYLGLFLDLKEAEQIILEARKKYHGEFAKHQTRLGDAVGI